jgi:hypothetical protein
LNTNKLSVAKHISIHYRRDSAPARADAQHLASWLASSGLGTPRLLTTEHGVASPVVRYFFKEDAGVSPFWSVHCRAEIAVGAQRTVGATGISLRQERSRCGRMRDYANPTFATGPRFGEFCACLVPVSH